MRLSIFSLYLTAVACTGTSETAPSSSLGTPSLQLTGEALGTTWNVKVLGLEESKVTKAQSKIETVLNRINDEMSTWKKTSKINGFNERTDYAYTFSPETAGVIEQALHIARETGGAFDPTVGPLVALWGFGAGAAKKPPSESELEEARAKVGYQHLLWVGPNQLQGAMMGMKLDLSANAKGYAVDAVTVVMKRLGAHSGMVEIGGEVRAWGQRPDGGPWRLAIETPKDQARPGQAASAVAQLNGLAMATSGDYRQFRMEDGKRISHTIDPRTGQPIGHSLASVTVFAPNCMDADAYATALMVLGPEAGMDLINQHPTLEALMILRNASGFELRFSEQVKAHLVGTL
jgi:thiamine biosynthesis lipoprotein